MSTEDKAEDRLEFMVGDNARAMLRGYVERIEALNEEIAGLTGDRKEVFYEAKNAGFDAKTLRKLITLRKMADEDRTHTQALVDLYMDALGMKR